MQSRQFLGLIFTLQTTIDAVGRLVIPKALRQALGLKPGPLLEICGGDGRLEIEIAPTPMHFKRRGKGLVAVALAGPMPELSSELVRDTLERTRR